MKQLLKIATLLAPSLKGQNSIGETIFDGVTRDRTVDSYYLQNGKEAI
jgi:hypothetical protein